jgi:hypothetical protein
MLYEYMSLVLMALCHSVFGSLYFLMFCGRFPVVFLFVVLSFWKLEFYSWCCFLVFCWRVLLLLLMMWCCTWLCCWEWTPKVLHIGVLFMVLFPVCSFVCLFVPLLMQRKSIINVQMPGELNWFWIKVQLYNVLYVINMRCLNILH